ncbi:NAD(P)-dependent oxidoreductase [Mycobacterium sp. 94-17]|uniref:NAD-dependent epimerase/dehydratase family protein n=1 Tax=Mycobacterium sp. 94-17 TaxID=2986147 RepID=UPI002D1F553D|nr:NAD(P)-dependent oxidoreductase [Mycobacterium sp. 94-17]MEB4208032.1 NAD(P)-dependent oxidoreductase [Mycobacterium sp. 94-17]
MSETVLVTGAFGLVGTATVKELAARGHQVVATDLGSPANRKAAAKLPPGAQSRWADLTDSDQVSELLTATAPASIVHLAGVIPPQIYRSPSLARRVNVTATATLVDAAEKLSTSTRFVLASSNAVYGSRNPHRHLDRLSADTPERPVDLYGGHKLEAEKRVRAAALDWVVLRLGGVFSPDPWAMPFSADALFFESAVPADGRMHAVDVRDVASAFAASCEADVVGSVLLIGGDDSHLLRYGDVGPDLTAALGLGDVLPHGRPGNPDSDDDWFVTDWMDTAPAQRALSFQQHTWPQLLEDMGAAAGWLRHTLGCVGPLARFVLHRQAAYRDRPGPYADPWAAFRARFGDPGLDRGSGSQ